MIRLIGTASSLVFSEQTKAVGIFYKVPPVLLCGVSVFWDQLHYRLSHYSSPPTKSLQRGAEKAKPSCFSPLEVSS